MSRLTLKMSSKTLQLVTVFCLLIHSSGSVNYTTVKMAFILPDDDSRSFSITRVRTAVDVALKKTKILSLSTYINFTATYMDSNCDPIQGTMAAYESYMNEGVHVFFGPVCSYSLAPVARYASVWNVPVVTAGAMSHVFRNKTASDGEYRTLTRVGVTFTTLSSGLLEILHQHHWNHVKIIVVEYGQSNIIPRFCYLIVGSIIDYMDQQKYKYSYQMWDNSTEKPDYILKDIINTHQAGLLSENEAEVKYFMNQEVRYPTPSETVGVNDQ